jgi:hypothetical protein
MRQRNMTNNKDSGDVEDYNSYDNNVKNNNENAMCYVQ